MRDRSNSYANYGSIRRKCSKIRQWCCTGRGESTGTGNTPCSLERLWSDSADFIVLVSPWDHLARIWWKSKSFCTAAHEPWREKRRQGGNSADELPGMAADLLWRAENRCASSADEFPLQCGRDRILSGSGWGRCTCVRTGVYRKNWNNCRVDQQKTHPVLCWRRLPFFCRRLWQAHFELRQYFTGSPVDRRRWCSYLFLFRHNRIPEGDSA